MLASIPSPPDNGLHVGPLFVHAYGLAYRRDRDIDPPLGSAHLRPRVEPIGRRRDH
jgi:hypothetical protein